MENGVARVVTVSVSTMEWGRHVEIIAETLIVDIEFVLLGNIHPSSLQLQFCTIGRYTNMAMCEMDI